MPRIRDRIWINTAKDEEVQKHRFLAGLQSIRNNFLKWKIKNIKLDSARIEPRNGREYGPRGDRVYDCLELLSKDLSDPTNRAEANNAIKSLVGNSEDWNDPLTIVLPLKADKLQQLRMNVKVLFTEYSFDTKATAFLQAVYNKSDAVLAGPKGYYHKKFDAPAPRELPPAKSTPPQANADAGPVSAHVPPPADPPPPADAPPPVPKAIVESDVSGKAPVRPDEVTPPPSTDEIAQLQEKAGGSRDSINAGLDDVLEDLASRVKPLPTEVRAQTPDTGRNPRVPKLKLPKPVQQNDASVSTPRGTPRPRLFSKAVKPEPVQSPRSPHPPAPEKVVDESKDATLNEVLDRLGAPDGPQQTVSLAAHSKLMEGMPPLTPILVTDRQARAQSVQSIISSPDISADETTAPTPPPPKQRDPKQLECDGLMNKLMTRMSGHQPLKDVLEALDKLADYDESFRASSLRFVTLRPDNDTLEYVHNAIHTIDVDLKQNIHHLVGTSDKTKRERLDLVVKQWNGLRLTTATAIPFNEAKLHNLRAALDGCKLGRQPTPPFKANA
jgi:hypothetical protein